VRLVAGFVLILGLLGAMLCAIVWLVFENVTLMLPLALLGCLAGVGIWRLLAQPKFRRMRLSRNTGFGVMVVAVASATLLSRAGSLFWMGLLSLAVGYLCPVLIPVLYRATTERHGQVG